MGQRGMGGRSEAGWKQGTETKLVRKLTGNES